MYPCILSPSPTATLLPPSSSASASAAAARSLNAPSPGPPPDTATSSLAAVLGLDAAIEESQLYHAMDWLLLRQQKIENALAKRHLSEGSLILYDVSSTYFEGRHCPLAGLGHSRD